MPKIQYEFKRFRGDTPLIIAQARGICEEYARAGYSLTLRQLYYRFVAGGLLANNDKNYKRLGNIVNDARLGGLIDWFHLEDRTRGHIDEGGWADPAQIITAGADGFHRNLWDATAQNFRPEVWVEKEAMADIVGRACREFRTPHFSCRGYVSQSAMWRAGRRMKRTIEEGYTPVVIHLGDHDPSGVDMTRDIAERLFMFSGRWIDVQRIALNMDQIEEHQPPPNPAKLSDSRAQEYINRFGYQSWELDALPPEMLDTLIRNKVREYVDTDAWEQADQEDSDARNQMRVVAERWDEISDRWDEIEEMLG